MHNKTTCPRTFISKRFGGFKNQSIKLGCNGVIQTKTNIKHIEKMYKPFHFQAQGGLKVIIMKKHNLQISSMFWVVRLIVNLCCAIVVILFSFFKDMFGFLTSITRWDSWFMQRYPNRKCPPWSFKKGGRNHKWRRWRLRVNKQPSKVYWWLQKYPKSCSMKADNCYRRRRTKRSRVRCSCSPLNAWCLPWGHWCTSTDLDNR